VALEDLRNGFEHRRMVVGDNDGREGSHASFVNATRSG
jgi:hypothetical protein